MSISSNAFNQGKAKTKRTHSEEKYPDGWLFGNSEEKHFSAGDGTKVIPAKNLPGEVLSSGKAGMRKKPANRGANTKGKNKGPYKKAGPGQRWSQGSGKNVKAVATALVHEEQRIAGLHDAVTDRQQELEDTIADIEQMVFNDNNNNGNGGNTPHNDGSGGGVNRSNNVIPQSSSVDAADAKVSTLVENNLTFEMLVTSHFIAFEYTDKSLKSASGNILRWRQLSKDTRSIPELASVIHDIYASRANRLPWWKRWTGNWNDWFQGVTPTVVQVGLATAAVAIGGMGLLAAMGTKKPLVATLVTGAAVYTAYNAMTKDLVVTKTTNEPDLLTYCTGTKLDPSVHQIDKGSKLKISDSAKLNARCNASFVKIGFTFARESIWVPRNCIHNELNALVTRQMQQHIPFTTAGKVALHRGLNMVSNTLAPVNISVPQAEWKQKFLEKYPAKRRDAINRELDNTLLISPEVKGFPKIEVMVGKPVKDRKVRFISGFSDGYLAETGPEYYFWQKEMCATYWKDAVIREQQQFVYTGGLLANEVGDWFSKRAALGRVFLLLDFSKFDSRNKEEILKALTEFYKKHLSQPLMNYLHKSFNKKGKTSHGIIFAVIATVASGRIDTSFGNTIIVMMLVVAILFLLDPNYLDDFDMSALGDDNNTSLPSFHHTIEDIKRVSLELGHQADGMIVYPDEYYKLEFCSQRLWEYQPSEMVCGFKIGRLLAKTFVTHRAVPDDKMVAHISGVMTGLKNYSWLPVFRAVYKRWFEVHPGPGQKYYTEDESHKMQLRQELVVDDATIRDQFIKVYGFEPESLEADIMKLNFNIGDCYSHPLMDRIMEIDGVSYQYSLADYLNLRHERAACRDTDHRMTVLRTE